VTLAKPAARRGAPSPGSPAPPQRCPPAPVPVPTRAATTLTPCPAPSDGHRRPQRWCHRGDPPPCRTPHGAAEPKPPRWGLIRREGSGGRIPGGSGALAGCGTRPDSERAAGENHELEGGGGTACSIIK